MLKFDRKRGSFVSNHNSLFRTFFKGGVLDFAGHRRWPSDGEAFLTAVYAGLFLLGERVRWRWGAGTGGVEGGGVPFGM
jgi:hypothetical protein